MITEISATKPLKPGNPIEAAVASDLPNPERGDLVLLGDQSHPFLHDQVAVGGVRLLGAQQGSNAAGTIPPWTGGLSRSQWPAAFQPGGRLVDPFPGDKPKFTVTAANVGQYAGQLSDGHRALFAKYPDYTMPVYETRRTVGFPQAIYDATKANNGRARAPAADSLEGANLGFPFPQPKTGVEVLWNHRVRYRGDAVQLSYKQAVVAADGAVRSEIHGVTGEARVIEIARMLAGDRLSGTSLAHAQEMLASVQQPSPTRPT